MLKNIFTRDQTIAEMMRDIYTLLLAMLFGYMFGVTFFFGVRMRPDMVI